LPLRCPGCYAFDAAHLGGETKLRDLNGLYANRGEELPAQPTWKMLAEVLLMASGYE